MSQWSVVKSMVGIMSVLFSLSTLAAAIGPSVIPPLPTTQPAFNWVFSGIVTNEQAERYGFYFQIQGHENTYQVLSTLVDLEKNALIFVEENKAEIATVNEMNWQVGGAYLGFKPINNSWVFGVKTKSKQGFNFKIDTLSEVGQASKTQTLRPGLLFFVNQTGRLTGHLHLGSDQSDAFVTAKSAWFRQLNSQAQSAEEDSHPVTNMLCQFDDGSGFYATQLPERDALHGFIAGWRDAEGKPVSMSQFIRMKQLPTHEWQVSLALPALEMQFRDLLAVEGMPTNAISAGVVMGKRSGFCAAGKEIV